MPEKGAIDFHRPLLTGGITILRSFEENGRYRLLPQALTIATREDKRPDFSLEMVRGQNPLLPPAPYGVLDFRVQPQYRTEDALIALREQEPKASLSEANFISGFIRLSAVSDVAEASRELFQPVPLVWNGLGVARFVLRLGVQPALLLKNALIAEALPLTAIAEMFISGVSPRLSLAVRFDPARLMSKVAALGDTERRIIWQDVVEFFRRDVGTLPLEIVGGQKDFDPNEFAQAMADRVCQRYGTFIPSPKNDAQAYLRLQAPGDIGSGTFEWNLSEPTTVTRPLVLTFSPLEVARQLVRDVGPDAVIRETTVPPIKIGTVRVDIHANLPAQRLGVRLIGVTISAPPRPPMRPQAIKETVEFAAPKDSATALLRLSPAEKPDYTYKSFVVLESEMKRYEGPEVPHSGNYLALQPADFPLTFVPIEAANELLELADIRVICHYSQNGTEPQKTFDFSGDRGSAVIALRKSETGVTLDIEARSKDGQRVLRLSSIPATPLRLGLTSFREYGPHEIEIECVFANDLKLIAIDLLAEGRTETPSEITTLHFTPAKPKREWTWFAKSPFYPGYRYRLRGPADSPPIAWSQPRSPFERLVIDPASLEGGAP
jgi:hypothetical protein